VTRRRTEPGTEPQDREFAVAAGAMGATKRREASRNERRGRAGGATLLVVLRRLVESDDSSVPNERTTV